MPLQDHFHPPLKDTRPWQSVHSAWANAISTDLNQRLLPSRYTALPEVKLGGSVEIDVATIEELEGADVEGWTWPAPNRSQVIDLATVDVYEIKLFRDDSPFDLVAAIELISPRNKDRTESRSAFTTKCANYLKQGIHLLIVDIVTDRMANLHLQLLDLMQMDQPIDIETASDLYAVSYRSVAENSHTRIDWWQEPIAVGARLPRMPLWLDSNKSVPVDLEATYTTACASVKIFSANGC